MGYMFEGIYNNINKWILFWYEILKWFKLICSIWLEFNRFYVIDLYIVFENFLINYGSNL